MSAFIDRTGHRYGRLTVVSCAGSRNGRYNWKCRCDCGEECTASGLCLASGDTKSCGCLNAEKRIARSLRHGHSRRGDVASGYRTWLGMKQRCCNVRNKSYPHYGGRGIKVCDRWLESFENFLADMGPRPAGSSLDRIDNSGNYCPENCQWATRIEQGRNKRSNVLITWKGATKTLIEWSEETGIPYITLYTRLHREGWPIERALTKPVRRKRKGVA